MYKWLYETVHTWGLQRKRFLTVQHGLRLMSRLGELSTHLTQHDLNMV